ncbi:PASTA domain-containing protein [Caldifermentibacillus hisashii]|uniref:PASTA domain-containing protein n=1 Tax=Caldifermentibacillus hisashii TaxID=996558 RepID=UPI00268AAA13|nr:PASTA domain-containing protein [Caldifermentibacillus hisashii]
MIREKIKERKIKRKKKGNKQKRKKWPFVLIFTSLLIILMGILVLTTDVFGAKDVKVPDVRNMKLDDAIKELEKANFVIGDTIEKPDDKIRENYVLKTNPKAGSMKAEGSKITIYVSTGKETIEMEDYRGEQFDEVQALLTEQELNFKSIEVNEEYSDKEAGIILDQNPAPGKKVVPEDTDLVFTVSKGDQSISLKDLTNYSTEDLNYYMKATGINITTTEQYHDTIPKGNVISQDVKPGTSLKKGATVHVVVSKGKEEKPPKTVTIDISVVYTGNPEEKQVQHVQIFIDDMNHDFSVPYETFDMTETTRKRFDLVIQPNSSGRYKVVIDNQVVQDQVVPYE